MKRIYLFVISFFVIQNLFAQIPHTISYQGILTDASGNPKPDGNYQFTFYLYDVSTGGTALWNESKSLPISKGLFSTSLGDQTAFGTNVKFDKPYWLGIKVGSDPELTPRLALSSSGYSITTENVSVPLILTGSVSGSNYIISGTNNGTGHGLLGVSTSGYGTVGISTGTTGETIGVVGNAYSPDGFAISGWNRSTTGNAIGVRGLTDSPNGIGVRGIGGSNGIGVWGSSTNYQGVLGQSQLNAGIVGSSQQFHGIYGVSHSNNNGGVIGINDATGFGVIGTTNGDGIGVYGKSIDGYGVYGESVNGLAGVFAGKVRVTVLEITGGSDLAEPFETNETKMIEKGSVMVIDENNPGKLKLSTYAYDNKVAGIVSGAGDINPGITLKQDGILEGNILIALSGKVYCKAEAFSGPIKPGDLLTTSSIPGYAMKVTDNKKSHGTVIGKAMTGLDSGKGLVLVLVNLQ